MRKAIVLLVGFAVLSAGCLGFGEESDQLEPTGEPSEDGADTNDSSNDTSRNDTDGNETGGNRSSSNGTGENRTAGNETQDNQTDDGNQTGNETRWSYDNRTGTVSGTNAVATEASSSESFNVSEDARELQLDLSAEGGELDVCIQAPDGGNESEEESECAAEESTQDGNLTWSTSSPAHGGWTIEMTAQGVGPQSVDYELVIGQLVPADASGNETSGNETDGPYP